MKTLIFLFIFAFSLFAGMGDCVRCHPTLQNDKNHQGMKSCIKCHTKSTVVKTATECGDKCFKCHSEDDMDAQSIPEHKIFEECRDCHIKEVDRIFDVTLPNGQSHQQTLHDFLQ